MSKKSREAIKANLERAISPSAPPTKRSAHLDGLLDDYAPLEEAKRPLSSASSVGLEQGLSPTPNASHAFEHNYALRDAWLASPASHASNVSLKEQRSELWSSVTEQRGYSKFHNVITDQLYRLLDPIEQAIYTQLFRLSHGFDKPTCIISLPKLSERAHVSQTATHNGIKRLVAKGLVEKHAWIVGKGKEQGIEFSLTFPAWLTRDASHAGNASHASRAPIKEQRIKEHTQTQDGAVCVSSKFNLSECRRYAEHLFSTKQGITNPGGYATKIHRSGEADFAIAEFLAPTDTPPAVDASRCPDCHGTGFWEPGGAGKGVAKCKHVRLERHEPSVSGTSRA